MPVYWAVQRPDIKVVALDLSEAMLERARAHAEQRGVTERVRFLVADATDTGLLSGSFDVVVCHYMLHHFADPAKVLREMVRLVRPGGAVLVRDLARPGPVFARLSTLFTAVFLRNDREQNRQYAESLAASLTTRELRDVIAREELTGFDVRGGPVHITAMRRPESAATRNPLTHERLGRMLAGTTVLIALALAQFVSPWFLLVAAGAGLNLALSGLTDRCVVKNLLVKLGLPGERDLGRAEVLMDLPVHPPGEPLSLRRRQPVNPIGVRAD
jgi:SAM-dependent methyltransferase